MEGGLTVQPGLAPFVHILLGQPEIRCRVRLPARLGCRGKGKILLPPVGAIAIHIGSHLKTQSLNFGREASDMITPKAQSSVRSSKPNKPQLG